MTTGKNAQYSASDMFDVGLNFYAIGDEEFDCEGAKKASYKLFKKKLPEINNVLRHIGLECKKVSIYTPDYFNFQGDDITLHIHFINTSRKTRMKYISFLYRNKDAINSELKGNVPYDGYIPLTVESVAKEEERIMQGKMPDIIALSYIFKPLALISMYDIMDIIEKYQFVYE